MSFTEKKKESLGNPEEYCNALLAGKPLAVIGAEQTTMPTEKITQIIAKELFKRDWTIPNIAEKLKLGNRLVMDILQEEIPEKIRTLYQRGQKYKEIAVAIGISERTIMRSNAKKKIKIDPTNDVDAEITNEIAKLLKEEMSVSEIALLKNITTDNIRNLMKNIFVLEYLHLQGLNKLQETYHMAKATIHELLTEEGVRILESGEMTKIVQHVKEESFYREISPQLQEILEGEIAGDGNVRINIKKEENMPTDPALLPSLQEYKKNQNFLMSLQEINDIAEITDKHTLIEGFNTATKIIASFPTAYFRLHKSILESRWVEYIGKKFEENGYPVTLKEYLKKNKEDEYIWYIGLESKASVQLYKMYDQWYKNKIKIIPDDLKLTPDFVKHLFIGDGTFNGYQVSIATDSFIKHHVDMLATKLNKIIKIETHVNPHIDKRYADKEYWQINISGKDNIEKFFAYIEKGDKNSTQLVKQEFPWKFDRKLTKKEILSQRKMNGERLALLYEERYKEKEIHY